MDGPAVAFGASSQKPQASSESPCDAGAAAHPELAAALSAFEPAGHRSLAQRMTARPRLDGGGEPEFGDEGTAYPRRSSRRKREGKRVRISSRSSRERTWLAIASLSRKPRERAARHTSCPGGLGSQWLLAEEHRWERGEVLMVPADLRTGERVRARTGPLTPGQSGQRRRSRPGLQANTELDAAGPRQAGDRKGYPATRSAGSADPARVPLVLVRNQAVASKVTVHCTAGEFPLLDVDDFSETGGDGKKKKTA